MKGKDLRFIFHFKIEPRGQPDLTDIYDMKFNVGSCERFKVNKNQSVCYSVLNEEIFDSTLN